LLHQYQRPLKLTTHQGKPIEYIEVTRQDIATANRLAHEVLGRSLDELAPQTRRLLHAIDTMVSEACQRSAMERSDFRFSRRDVREHTGMGHAQLAVHLHRLEALEYVIVHRGGRGQSFVYELAYNGEGQDGTCFLMSLCNPEPEYDAKFPGSSRHLPGSFRPHSGALPGPIRGRKNVTKPLGGKARSETEPAAVENARLGNGHDAASYVLRDRSHSVSPLAAAKP